MEVKRLLPLAGGSAGNLRALKGRIPEARVLFEPIVRDEASLSPRGRRGLGELPRVETESMRLRVPRWEIEGPGELAVDGTDALEVLAVEFAINTISNSAVAGF